LPLLRWRMVEDAVEWVCSRREYARGEDCAHTVVAMSRCRGWTEATRVGEVERGVLEESIFLTRGRIEREIHQVAGTRSIARGHFISMPKGKPFPGRGRSPGEAGMCARVVTVIGDGRVYFGRGGRGPLGGGPGQGGKLEFPMEGILVW
jgi:hypothetical protein